MTESAAVLEPHQLPDQDDIGWDDREQGRERFRDRMIGEISSSYRPWLHLLATTAPGLVLLGLAIWRLDDVKPLEWLLVPTFFVVANLAEWFAHTNLLHRRFKPAAVLYDRHTPQHHRIYRYGQMAIRDRREFKLVLIPAYGVGAILLISTPVALAVGLLWSENAGWLTWVTQGMATTSYELLHLAYHLPEDHPIGKWRVIRRLREHHALHHDPRLMQRWNFNVTFPLGDWIFGTIAPGEQVERARARARAASR